MARRLNQLHETKVLKDTFFLVLIIIIFYAIGSVIMLILHLRPSFIDKCDHLFILYTSGCKMCVGQQLWEIQEGRFGSPVPADVMSILASEFGISTDLLEFEKLVQLHNVSNKITHVVTCTTYALLPFKLVPKERTVVVSLLQVDAFHGN